MTKQEEVLESGAQRNEFGTMKILILGLGNEIKRDDAIGLVVTDELEKKFDEGALDFKTLSSGKLLILDEVRGYDKAIIIDSITTENGTPGDVYSLRPGDMETKSGISLSHNIDMEILSGDHNIRDKQIPEVKIVAIEAKNTYELGETLSKELEENIPEITEKIQKIIEGEIKRD